jgi:antitoxin VapB
MGYERRVKLFRNGRNQAVRIPREFELPGDEAVMHKEGAKLVIEPARDRAERLRALLEKWRREGPLPPEEQFPDIEDLPAEPFDL